MTQHKYVTLIVSVTSFEGIGPPPMIARGGRQPHPAVTSCVTPSLWFQQQLKVGLLPICCDTPMLTIFYMLHLIHLLYYYIEQM